jgi:tetratricopeptide (TPR) repeat protein
VRNRLPLASICVVVLSGIAFCQTYDIHGGAASTSGQQTEPKAPSTAGSQAGGNLGWGSSIEVSRRARAAQEAINRGAYGDAVSFAEQAANSAPQSVDLWFLLGYAARLAQQYQKSIDAYNRGLRIEPNSIRGLAGLAQTYARMGRDSEAERLLQRVIHSNSKDVTSLQLAGELLLTTDSNNALQLLRRADALQPSPRTELLMARAYQRLGDQGQARRYLQLARSRGPNNPEVLRAVAAEYRDQGQYDQAIATLQAIPSKSPDAQADLAYTYQLAGKQDEAARLYTRLAKSAKGNIGLDLSAAQALLNLGQVDAAHAFVDDARRIDPNSYRLHSILGQIAIAEDRPGDARNEYVLALSNLPSTVPEGPLYPIEIRLNLYELDLQQENQADAAKQLRDAQQEIQAAQVSPEAKPELLRLRAAVEAASGNVDAASNDLKLALSLAPSNVNVLLNFGSLQWKMKQPNQARSTFEKVLQLDKNNRTALSSLGYLARDRGDTKEAEAYFSRAANGHPRDYAPHLALGDLFTSERKLRAAETEYERAYERMPNNAAIVSGGANAAMEAHNLDLAKRWLDRAQGSVNDSPLVSRERERYLTFKGDYANSAKLGYKVLQKLPNDREGVVYLLYDLYYLGRYDEVQKLVQTYDARFSEDKDFALVSGYLAVRKGKLQDAFDDFTRALTSDPKMATGYVSRGSVLNDLHQPDKAAHDFEAALHIQPDYGEAHLGLAYADLQRHRPRSALVQLNAAGKILGKTHAWHLARAEAYRQGQDYAHAIPEYRLALEETPNDVPTRLAYADSLYHLGNFKQALSELATAEKFAPTNAEAYALGAQIYARQNDRDNAQQEIKLAEQYGNGQAKILMATGNALLTLGEKDAAMQRFTRALDAPGESHLGVRLALARLFAERDDFDGTRRQVALGFAEARANNSPVSSEDILQAANVFLAIHDFDLAESYFKKSHLAGANPRSVSIGLTNTYLAEGKTQEAGKELATLGPASDYQDDYEYMMTAANLYRQRQDSVRALSAFAQANSVATRGDGTTAEIAQYQTAEQEGRELNETFSILPEATFTPAFEDINVYALDAKILKVGNAALLPPPRHSYQSLVDSHYRIHIGGLPVISGFVGESLTAGRLLFPSVNVVEDRNTYDTFLNGGISPVLHFGPNSITFNGGLQYTIRRDTISPQFMSQNLFRQFLYVSTNSFFNWLAIHGSATREAGPFTDRDLHSRDAFANIEFTVGRPWGNTSLLAGYSVRDLLFRPSVVEYFTTSTYAGLQHKFGDRLSAAVLAESLRSWEVFHSSYAIAQAVLPGARFDLRASPRWSVHGSFLLSRGQGFHQYDNAQSEFTVSYVRPIHGTLKDGGDVPVSYPLRFSFGVEQQTFYNFAGSTRTTLLPVFHLTLF